MRLLKLRFLLLGVALLGVALLVPVALLVDRALESVAFERQARHDVIAERVFDEVERELSALLEREEARPFAEYAFYFAPETGKKSGPVEAISPLAQLPREDWLVGYFQINPDGSFQTPHQPLDRDRAQREGDWLPDPEVATRVKLLEDAVAGYWSGSFAAELPATRDAEEQRAGTTVELAPKRALLESSSDTFSAYDALSSLNRGAEQRRERKTRVLEETVRAPSEPWLDAKLEMDSAEESADASAGLASRTPASPPVARKDAPARPGEAEPERSGRRAGGRAKQRANLPAAAPAHVRVAVDPMGGRAINDTHLVLFRTVLRGSRGYRQGLVIDTPRFAAWLGERALGSSGLEGRAELRFATGRDAGLARPARTPWAYRRRFAEPFADLRATLELESLPGLGGGRYVLALSGLLIAVGALGLLALYRMVAVALRFAERRSNFAAAVSHELKTPLTAIRMYAEMLRDGMVDSDEKRHEYYEAMTAESERLSRLIHNVLEFSQLEKGTRELSLESGSLEPVLRETERLLRTHVEREGFAFAVAVDPELPQVRFDRDALLQVLFNLVDNALKYAADATDRRICLCCRRDDSGVRISVRDFGPGVSEQKLPRVFEPFYRGEAELTRRTRGTGIGLALVRGLVEAMGARVDAQNAEPGLRVNLRFRSES